MRVGGVFGKAGERPFVPPGVVSAIDCFRQLISPVDAPEANGSPSFLRFPYPRNVSLDSVCRANGNCQRGCEHSSRVLWLTFPTRLFPPIQPQGYLSPSRSESYGGSSFGRHLNWLGNPLNRWNVPSTLRAADRYAHRTQMLNA